MQANEEIKKVRYVKVGDLRKFLKNDLLEFTLPGLKGETLVASPTRVKFNGKDDFVWSAEFVNRPGYMSIVQNQKGRAGFFQVDDQFFTLIPSKNSQNLLVEYNTKNLKPAECLSPGGAAAASQNYCAEDNNTCPATITILILNTPEAQAFFDTFANPPFGAIFFWILGVESVNMAIDNSGIPNKEVVWVSQNFTMNLTQNPPNIVTDVNNLSINAQGLRDAFHADLVVMLTDDRYPNVAGIAFQGPCFDCAFAIVEVPFMVDPRWTFAHEVAHMLGAWHNRSANVPCFGCGDDEDECAHALRFIDGGGTERRTALAISNALVQGDPQERILHYSNPDVAFNGGATGTVDDDNARTIRNAGCLVSNYFPPQEISVMISGPTLICPGDPTPYNPVINEPAQGFPGQPPYAFEWRWGFSSVSSGFFLTNDQSISLNNFPFLYNFSSFWLILNVTSLTDGTVVTTRMKVTIDVCSFNLQSPGDLGGNASPATTAIRTGSLLKERSMNAGTTSVIFPNPTSGKISIYLDSLDEKSEIAIYDSRGKLVRNIQLSGSGEQQLEADLSGLAPGFYLFRVPTKSGWESHKIVLTK